MSKKILVVLFIILFTLILPPVISLYNAKAILFDTGTTKKLFRDNNIYNKLTFYINKSFREQFEKSGLTPNKAGIPKELFTEDLIQASWLEKTSEKIIDDLARFLKGETDSPLITVSVDELKSSKPYLAVWGGEAIPNEINVVQLLYGFNASEEDQEKFFNGIITLRTILEKIKLGFYIALAVLFLLLMFIILLVGRPLRSLFRWFGFTIFFPGFFLFLGSLVVKFFLSQISLKPAEGGVEMPEVIFGLQKVLAVLFNNFISKNLFSSAILLGIGLLLIIISFFFKKKLGQEILVEEAENKPRDLAPSQETTIIEKSKGYKY